MSFSFLWISIRTRGLIRIKSISKSAEYFSQLFISIIAPIIVATTSHKDQ